jgi:hypothetical protein
MLVGGGILAGALVFGIPGRISADVMSLDSTVAVRLKATVLFSFTEILEKMARFMFFSAANSLL